MKRFVCCQPFSVAERVRDILSCDPDPQSPPDARGAGSVYKRTSGVVPQRRGVSSGEVTRWVGRAGHCVNLKEVSEVAITVPGLIRRVVSMVSALTLRPSQYTIEFVSVESSPSKTYVAVP